MSLKNMVFQFATTLKQAKCCGSSQIVNRRQLNMSRDRFVDSYYRPITVVGNYNWQFSLD